MKKAQPVKPPGYREAIATFDDGIAILGDSTSLEVMNIARVIAGDDGIGLIIADPPYGNIVSERWDQVNVDDVGFSDWMVDWTNWWTKTCLLPGGAFYVWGGIGKPGFRPFLRYLRAVERKGSFELANLITWKKRRAVGRPNNYLYTREELAYFIKGDARKPRCFNVPLLDQLRGYPGYDPKHPAKSEFLRRSNVWTDITEMLRGKVHPTQKHQRLHEVMIEVHTQPGDWVVDPFAGAGTTAFAARKLGRRFIVIEKDERYFDEMVARLNTRVGEGKVRS